jgi:hypothetical protein
LQKSPLTDKHLGVTTRGYDVHSFSDVRAKAKEELEERCRKSKRNKAIKLPEFLVDDEVVVTSDLTNNPKYTLVKVVDWEEDRYNSFMYFGIVLKTTSKDLQNRVGRLIRFAGEQRYFCYSYANIKPEDVTWELKKN